MIMKPIIQKKKIKKPPPKVFPEYLANGKKRILNPDEKKTIDQYFNKEEKNVI